MSVADVHDVRGDTRRSVSQGVTAGSKSLQNGGVELRQAAATAYHALPTWAADYFGVPAERLIAAGGRFRVAGRNPTSSVTYAKLLSGGETFVPLNPDAPLVDPDHFNEVPTIEIILIDRPHEPALGAGEPASEPSARPSPTPSSPRPANASAPSR